MNRLNYSEAEILQNDDFARPHVIEGRRMHGGFDASGTYVPPRAGKRNEALDAWTAALRRRGGDLFAADASLLRGARMPNVEQQRFLLRNGLGQWFWNSLTTTGKIEGRGRVLAEMKFPNLQKLAKEDISSMAIGHLNKGLLVAHGFDEGGEPDKGIGGHDVMWFVARDLVFGANAYPDIEPPASIARPEAGRRWMPEIAMEYEGMLSFLMNLLLIEFRAEIGFANSQNVFRTADLFPARRAAAEQAAEIIERIRTDEEIHVRSLRLYLGELRAMQLATVDGGEISGAKLIDRFWDGLIAWATVEQPRIVALQQYEMLKPRILALPHGERLLREFDALSDLSPTVAAAG
ncbi:MAG TPA: hypothetical protein VIZ30_09470 [Pseudomonadales bacterium]